MAVPQIVVEIAFADLPLAVAPTYTDVSAYAQSIPSIRRGRSNALGRMEAGTATVILDNGDRRFDSVNTAGPYYPNVQPMRKIRISAIWAATTYRLFTGYVEAWQGGRDGLDATVTLRCVDAFAFFALRKMTGTWASEFGNDAIATQLTAVAWPAGDRELNSSESLLQGGTFSNTPLLTHFQTIEASENGLFLMGPDGKVVWQGRHFRLEDSASITSQATFTNSAASTLPYARLTPSYDADQIYNEVSITRLTSAHEGFANDATSQARYFVRTLTKSGLLISTDNELDDAAAWLLATYKDAALRFTQLVLDGHSNDALWPHMLGRRISERVTVSDQPPGGGAAIVQDCMIESISHQIDEGQQRFFTTFQLSAAGSGGAGAWWVLGDATLSVLDSTTRVAY